MYFSLYQQLSGNDDDDEKDDDVLGKLSSLFKPDFFDLVIVDECHRGSAKKDSNWRKILEYFRCALSFFISVLIKQGSDFLNFADNFPILRRKTVNIRDAIDQFREI